MKIKIDSDLLSSIIKTIQRVSQATQLSIEITKNDLKIKGSGGGSSCMMFCPCKVVSKSENRKFTTTSETLINAISKRKDIELTVNENSVHIKSKNYQVELLTLQYEEIEVMPEVKGNQTKIGRAHV